MSRTPLPFLLPAPGYHGFMNRGKAFGLTVTTVVFISMFLLFRGEPTIPALSTFLFWIILLIVAELLPVSLGFGARITMAFPIHLAIEILFPPPVAMLIAGLGEADVREFRREVPLWQGLFNRAQLMAAVGAASSVIHIRSGGVFEFPAGAALIALGAATHVATNLGLVGLGISLTRGLGYLQTIRSLIPDPALGFWMSQALLAGFGAATAAVYERIGAFVASFLIPLLFARISLLAARAQQELSRKVQKQQQSLLEASEKVFQEREQERHRIAADIHDGSLQMLTAATYKSSNAIAQLDANNIADAKSSIAAAGSAIEGAIQQLRDALVDLRRSSVEEGGLMQTISKFADDVSTLWGTEVHIEGDVRHEPPIPVALAAFQILQEGLVNALKHAESSQVWVRISDDDDGMVHIVVQDDGSGFDPDAEVGADHVGMRLMRERASHVGGRIEVRTEPGAGTKLEAILPGGVEA